MADFKDDKSNTSEELSAMLPDAIRVIRETILGTGEWAKDSISCSQWVIEKMTGKPTTQEADTGTGLLRQLLLEIREQVKANAEDKLAGRASSVTNLVTNQPKDFIADFVNSLSEDET